MREAARKTFMMDGWMEGGRERAGVLGLLRLM
jgi:hypothetical protein